MIEALKEKYNTVISNNNNKNRIIILFDYLKITTR